MKVMYIMRGGKEYRVEIDPRDCFNYLVRVYQGNQFCGKVISNDIGYAIEQIIGKETT